MTPRRVEASSTTHRSASEQPYVAQIKGTVRNEGGASPARPSLLRKDTQHLPGPLFWFQRPADTSTVHPPREGLEMGSEVMRLRQDRRLLKQLLVFSVGDP